MKKPFPNHIRKEVSQAITKAFEKLRFRLLGEDYYEPIVDIKNEVKNDSILSLPGLYTSGFESENPEGYPSKSSIEGLARVSDSYLVSQSEKLKAQLLRELENRYQAGDFSDLDEAIQNILDRAQGEVKRSLESELHRASTLGATDGLIQKLEAEGLDDPYVFFKIADDAACLDCKRIYCLPDKVTPRVYKLSEVSYGYYKKGDTGAYMAPLHPNCLISAQHRVLTSKGWRYVSDISVGDEVFTHNFRFKKVTNTLNWLTKIYRGSYYLINNGQSYNVAVTPEHKLWINNKEMKEIQQATDLDVISFLTVNCCNCNNPVVYNRTKLFCNKDCRNEFLKSIWKNVEKLDNKPNGVKTYNIKNNVGYHQKIKMPAMLFDIEVEEDHSFIVNGLISSNCRCTINHMKSGFKLNSDGSQEYVGGDYDEYENQRSLRKAVDPEDFNHICQK